MLVKLRRQDLLDQLPKDVRYLLIASGESLPEVFILNVVTAEEQEKLRTDYDEMRAKYPDIRKALTWTQWAMFCKIEKSGDLGVSKHVLKGMCNSKNSSYDPYNLVAAHISGLNRNLVKNLLPYRIKGSRSNLGEGGRYFLIRTDA